jgi:hypothetical protein
MGQYYRPCFIVEHEEALAVIAALDPHDYDEGGKLMEHSWLKNEFVKTVEQLLSPEGDYHGFQIVWAGDYAKEEPEMPVNIFTFAKEQDLIIKPPKVNQLSRYRYVINHSKEMYVDKMNISNINGWRIHPLPLLTCEGNGQGGGDYFGEDPDEIIGSWARDRISCENTVPEGYSELTFNLLDKELLDNSY